MRLAARRVAGGPVLELRGPVGGVDLHAPASSRRSPRARWRGAQPRGSGSTWRRVRTRWRPSAPRIIAGIFRRPCRRGLRSRRSRAARRRTRAPCRCAAPRAGSGAGSPDATVSTIERAMIGSKYRPVSAVSWRTIVLATSTRPSTVLPFITAVFISRTVSKARRTISSTAATSSAVISLRLELVAVDRLYQIVGDGADRKPVRGVGRRSRPDAGIGGELPLSEGQLDANEAIALVIHVAVADEARPLLRPARRFRPGSSAAGSSGSVVIAEPMPLARVVEDRDDVWVLRWARPAGARCSSRRRSRRPA